MTTPNTRAMTEQQPSTQATITDAIERTLTSVAPEIHEVERETARPLLQIGPRPSDPALGASGR